MRNLSVDSLPRSMSATDDLLENSRAYADRFRDGSLPTEPRRRIAVVCCMDSRIDLFALLGLENGEAHVIRNAGGIVTDDVIRSLAISQVALNTREVMIIQHTQCGLHGVVDDELRSRIEAQAGSAPPGRLGGFDDLEESVRKSVGRLKRSGCLVSDDAVRGFVYEVETGRLREVT
jgi:carbonic anhydrase